jgi:subtilase family serine protease
MVVRPLHRFITVFAALAALAGTRAGAQATGMLRTAPDQPVALQVHVALRNEAELEKLVSMQSRLGTQVSHHFLTPAQFNARYGPDPSDVAAVVAELKQDGFVIGKIDAQLIRASAPAAKVERVFQTRLATISKAGHSTLAPVGAFKLPASFTYHHAIVTNLTGMRRPVPEFRRVNLPQNRFGPYGGYLFDDLKQAYQYPSYLVANGNGTHIAVVGYSDSSDSDANKYFRSEKLGVLKGTSVPTIQHFAFPGSEAFDPTSDYSLEADIDVQQSGGSAPGATIDVYAASVASDESFLDTYATIDDTDVDDVVTTSYGSCELAYTSGYNGGQSYIGILAAYHDAFLQGNSEGITFVFSSGDSGGNVCPPAAYFTNAGAGVTYAAIPSVSGYSDPNLTSVGGTTSLTTAYKKGSLNSAYVRENSLADPVPFAPSDPYGTGNQLSNQYWGSGGGISRVFGKPEYQQYLGYAARVVPDIAMHMGGCPFSSAKDCNPTDSYDIAVFDGQLGGVIGTSLSSPEFAGLLATLESITGYRLGNVNELLYNAKVLDPRVFHTGMPATDGVPAYAVKGGTTTYNFIYGLGTIDVYQLVYLLNPKLKELAGLPQTPTNP